MRKQKAVSELSSWSAENRRSFARCVSRWDRGGGEARSALAERIWSSTSGQIHDRAQVEAALDQWEAQEDRRSRTRQRVANWRAEREAEATGRQERRR